MSAVKLEIESYDVTSGEGKCRGAERQQEFSDDERLFDSKFSASNAITPGKSNMSAPTPTASGLSEPLVLSRTLTKRYMTINPVQSEIGHVTVIR